jgi:hypothetical protein
MEDRRKHLEFIQGIINRLLHAIYNSWTYTFSIRNII